MRAMRAVPILHSAPHSNRVPHVGAQDAAAVRLSAAKPIVTADPNHQPILRYSKRRLSRELELSSQSRHGFFCRTHGGVTAQDPSRRGNIAVFYALPFRENTGARNTHETNPVGDHDDDSACG